ncbi:hypothetical protein KAW65_00295 [candidate division WOR-3 bacterium]|nr:hypothetical protein [candidate division WOR-3 bacterium]
MNWHQLWDKVEEAIGIWKKMTGHGGEYGGDPMDGDETELFAKAVKILADDHEGNMDKWEVSRELDEIEKKMR